MCPVVLKAWLRLYHTVEYTFLIEEIVPGFLVKILNPPLEIVFMQFGVEVVSAEFFPTFVLWCLRIRS